MDAWCALWFWPLDKVGLLDGSASVYKSDVIPLLLPEPRARPARATRDPNFPAVWEMDSLFGETPKQLTLAEAAPRKPRPSPPPSPTAPRSR